MWKYFLLLLIVNSADGKQADFTMPNYGSALTEAIVDIILNFYMNESNTINIFYASEPEADSKEIEDVLDAILYLLKDKVIVQIKEHSQMKESTDTKWHNIIFCDTYESFLNIFNKIDLEDFAYQGFYLIAISRHNDGMYQMMHRIFEALWWKHIVNANILWMPPENHNEVLMWTYWPYSSSYCGKAIPLQHDHYRNRNWLRHVRFFPDKMINLHGNGVLQLTAFHSCLDLNCNQVACCLPPHSRTRHS
jgi:hypothetical protein